jgi:hypothetical protein
MALHKVTYPKSAVLIFRIVALQRKLLEALAQPGVKRTHISIAWLQQIWKYQDPDWVRKFCLGGKISALHPIKDIAGAHHAARQALFEEFNRQIRVRRVLEAGGDFQELTALQGLTPQLAASVKQLFGRFYQRLSHLESEQWIGYEFGKRSISNRQYKEHFGELDPVMTVCPYCDGSLETADLDHYYAKSRFPLLACSPWNLVPVCKSCNNHITAKGDQPALTVGPPPSADDWLHPFFKPASQSVVITLSGTPRDSIPRLCADDASEQLRVDNHFDLINQAKLTKPSLELSKRWTNNASGYFDKLVRDATRKGHSRGTALRAFVSEQLEDHIADRGKAAYSMIKAAVCRAILDRRPEYESEFLDSNPPGLA